MALPEGIQSGNKVLFIRADARQRMGTGHVMRCIALGQAWQDAGGRVIFMTCCDNTALKERISREGFLLKQIEYAYPDSTDKFSVLSCIEEYTIQSDIPWLVVDGYHFDQGYVQPIREAGTNVLFIDDYNHLPAYRCDLLLNQNFGSEVFHYATNAAATKMLGPEYALLRREFRNNTPPGRKRIEEVKRILITLGGSDPDNVTGQFLSALNTLDCSRLHIRVIIGAANPYSNELQRIQLESVAEIELLSGVSDMVEMYEWADLAVSAGGSTCWELCRMGLPFLIIIIAENQIRIAEGLDRAGAAVNLGWMENMNPEAVAETVGGLIRSVEQRELMAEKGRVLVDGQGASRVVERIIGEELKNEN